HLADERLCKDVAAVLARARLAGVVGIVCATANADESEAAMALAHKHKGLWCMAGVHPHDAKDADEHYLDRLDRLAGDSKNVAIGETGLDYHYNLSPPADQRRVFAAQLALAKRLGKPAVIHTREAFDDTLAILGESGADTSRVLFHSFTEGPAQARKVLDAGAMISFSGIATFKNAQEIRRAAKLVPDERILIETDSPYLSPEPVRRAKTNEPANVIHVAARLAAVRGTTPEAFAELTAANAARFFHLDIDVNNQVS
ncbi:MAG: TatD family hydrolase, partial [Phycisphaerae bacterium]|nr:TatD family hydrolase [Phycisphaerae bacterium]